MSKTAQEVILAPVITEKSMAAARDAKKFSFKVANDATKIDIKKAIEELFKVEVSKVNTIHMRGKSRRYGRFEGYTSSWKKAVVTLTPDSKNIEFFEGMM